MGKIKLNLRIGDPYDKTLDELYLRSKRYIGKYIQVEGLSYLSSDFKYISKLGENQVGGKVIDVVIVDKEVYFKVQWVSIYYIPVKEFYEKYLPLENKP